MKKAMRSCPSFSEVLTGCFIHLALEGMLTSVFSKTESETMGYERFTECDKDLDLFVGHGKGDTC